MVIYVYISLKTVSEYARNVAILTHIDIYDSLNDIVGDVSNIPNVAYCVLELYFKANRFNFYIHGCNGLNEGVEMNSIS